MKRKSLILLTLVVAMLSLSNVRVSAAPVQVSFQVGYVDPEVTQDEPHRDPVLPPVVFLEDGTLTFGTHCDGCMLRVVNDDDEVVYSTVIPTGTSIFYLPSTLSGDYELQIIQDIWCFYGWIEL